MLQNVKSPEPATGYNSIQAFARAYIAISLVGLGAILSISAYRFGPDGPLFYWGILPGAPFLIIAGIALIPLIPLRAAIGAAVGALAAVAAPYGSLLYASANYPEGGANIGLDLLLLATPLYLPIAMLTGAVIAYRQKS